MKLLDVGYEKLEIKVPWSFRNARCVRTVLDLGRRLGVPNIDREGVKHFALGDAVYQAEQVIEVYTHVEKLAGTPGGPSPCLL